MTIDQKHHAQIDLKAYGLSLEGFEQYLSDKKPDIDSKYGLEAAMFNYIQLAKISLPMEIYDAEKLRSIGFANYEDGQFGCHVDAQDGRAIRIVADIDSKKQLNGWKLYFYKPDPKKEHKEVKGGGKSTVATWHEDGKIVTALSLSLDGCLYMAISLCQLMGLNVGIENQTEIDVAKYKDRAGGE